MYEHISPQSQQHGIFTRFKQKGNFTVIQVQHAKTGMHMP